MHVKRIKDLQEKNDSLQERVKEMKKLEDKNLELERKIRIMEEKWEQFKDEIVQETVDKVRGKIEEDLRKIREEISLGLGQAGQPEDIALGRDVVEEVAVKVKEKMDKEREREERKRNVVLYVVPESKKVKEEDRNRDDKDTCEDLFEQVLQVDKENFKIQQVVRLGRYIREDKYRPLLVKFKDEKEKWNILSQAKKLKDAENHFIRKIRISKDLTVEERIEEKKVIDELWERRNQGDDNWQIKNGKLVRKR